MGGQAIRRPRRRSARNGSRARKTIVYFADAYASWQKGAIENQNKFICQYLPKGLDFRDVSDTFIKNVQYKINRRLGKS